MKYVLLATLGVMLEITPALAQTYIVKIRQIHPDGPYHIITCTPENKPCLLSLPLNEKNSKPVNNNNYIDAALSFSDIAAKGQFMFDREYLSVDPNKVNNLLVFPLTAFKRNVTTVSLYDKDSVQADQNLLILRERKARAELEIIIERPQPYDPGY